MPRRRHDAHRVAWERVRLSWLAVEAGAEQRCLSERPNPKGLRAKNMMWSTEGVDVIGAGVDGVVDNDDGVGVAVDIDDVDVNIVGVGDIDVGVDEADDAGG